MVHRQKDPSDRNATAVVDRAIQTLKKDLAGKVARDGGGWGQHVENVTEAYNARPHQAVTVAPEEPHQCPEVLPAPVRGGAGGFELRFHDGASLASHGWLRDFVEACAPGAPWLR